MMENPFVRGDYVIVHVPGRNPGLFLSKAQVTQARKAALAVTDLGQGQRFQCHMADAANASIQDGLLSDNGDCLWMPNPKVRAQFGKNDDDEPYLTFGLIDLDGGRRITLTWAGIAIPRHMLKVAVAHDEYKTVRATNIRLPLNTATVHETGAKDGKRRKDPRKNHDTAPNGKAYVRPARPHHKRVCAKDLAKWGV
jgi:hypothetical protein